jgi:hypothetical protein
MYCCRTNIWLPYWFTLQISWDLLIKTFISDRHKSISSHMRKVLKHITHYFDIWRKCLFPVGFSTSYPGSFLLWRKDPGRRWSRDLLKFSRFLINYLGFLCDNHQKAIYNLTFLPSPRGKTLGTRLWVSWQSVIIWWCKDTSYFFIFHRNS